MASYEISSKLDLICAITGCAVAQHCYNGDVTFLWENGNFNPYKIETLQQVDTICEG